MKRWFVEVVEVRNVRMSYEVEAETREDAEREAEKGNTVDEEELGTFEVASRHVSGVAEPADEGEGAGPAQAIQMGSLASIFGVGK